MDEGALASEWTVGRKCPGRRRRVSIALSQNFFFLAINAILPCGYPTIFLLLFLPSVFFSFEKIYYLGYKLGNQNEGGPCRSRAGGGERHRINSNQDSTLRLCFVLEALRLLQK